MKRAAALLLLPVLVLAGCGKEGNDPGVEATEVPTSVVDSSASRAPVIESEYGTPVKDRVATIGLLNKRNNLIQDLVMKPGEARRVGNVIVRLSTCERTLPWERPAETGAFVQVFVEERASASQPLTWRKAFSGWLFRNSPSLNAVEHPVYDVWVKDCAMKFPGEEEQPAAAASASNAAKPAGSASASPAPSPSPSASAAPSAAASPPSPVTED